MSYLSRQASRKEASKKISQWLACLFVLAGFLLPTVAQADKQLDAEMALFYEQVFGEKFVKKDKHLKQRIELKTRTKRQPHLQISKKQKQQRPFIVRQAKVTLLAKARVHPPTSASPSQKADMSALFAKAFGKPMPKSMAQGNKGDNSDDEEQNSKATNLNALFAKAFGKKGAIAGPSKVSVDLKINKTVLGDVTVFSNKKGFLDSVGTEEFLALLKDVVKAPVFEKVKRAIASKEKVRFKKLSKLGIKARYNSVDLSLDLKIKPALRKPLILSMLSKKKASVREENKIAA